MKYSVTKRITKRPYVLLCVYLLAFAFGCKKSEEQGTEPKEKPKPNIIFILTDDQRWDALGYAGNPLAHTPQMDKLAEQGVFFKNTIATTPICSASRASIFTGLHERTHRYSFSSTSIKPSYMKNAFPRLLKEAGYYTGLYGKFGVKYKGLDTLYHEHENYDLRYDRKDITSYYYKTLGKDTVHLTRYTGQKGLEFIKKAPKDKPFCLQLSFSAPHASDNTVEQYFWQEENNHVLANTTIPKANISEDAYYDKLPQLVKDGFSRLRWYWRYDTEEKYQHSVKGYFRMIAGIDNEIAKIRAELEQKGIADNTIIVLMGDNGFFLGERQISGKWLMYDNSIKVPLIVYDPRQDHHEDVDAVALNIDIPSTLLDFAGVAIPETWHGKSLKPLVYAEEKTTARDTILIEHLWDFKNIAASEGVRTKDWKYFRYVKDKTIEELYHLKNDPKETQNLAKDENYKDVLLKLRTKCDALIAHYADRNDLKPEDMSVVTGRTSTFSWNYPTTETQAAFQILVSSSKEKALNNIGDIWDTTKITSTEKSYQVALKSLPKGNYYWKIRVWDALNRVGAYTAPVEVKLK